MDDSLMQALVDGHMRAEGQGDIDGALAVYTDDIEHDVVGFPNSPTRGKEGARDFYTYLTANFRTEGWEVLHRYVARRRDGPGTAHDGHRHRSVVGASG
jgi:hypothetical protein